MELAKSSLARLKKGDIIDIIAPGYLKNPNEIELARDFLKSLGLVARIPADLIGKDPLHSNVDSIRAKHLTDAILSKDSNVIWCLRGGYGCAKLIESLSKIAKPKTPKLLIGYSDITFLHIFLNQQWNWPTLHAAVLAELATESEISQSSQDLISILFGKKSEIIFNELMPLNKASQTQQTINAKIVGGNLTISQTTLGTKWQINGKDNILFFEDIAEDAYRIDRALHQFLQAGTFSQAKAILFGEFTHIEKKEEELLIKLIIKKFANKLEIPAFYIKNIGHGDLNYPLPLGQMATLEKKEIAALSISSLLYVN